MGRAAITMKDVAEKAGVSLSTVSYVLSGTRPISEATRATILQAMVDLDFHPNAVARALASKRTRVIALLLSPEERGLGLPELEFVKGASEAARALDHHLVLLTEGMDSEADLAYLRHQGLVDGVILMEVRLNDPRVPLLKSLGLPFSLLGRPDPALGLPFADIDFDRTFERILRHLAGLGHRRVGFVNQSRAAFDEGYGPVVRAQEAWDAWVRNLGLGSLTVFSPPTPRDGWAACAQLLDGPGAPTALVVMNDRALPGLLQALASRGLSIPRDLSVVSAVTSARAAEMMVPSLTSADVPSQTLARQAVANLVKAIESPHAGLEHTLIPCEFVPRSSTGPCPKPISPQGG
jgi:DNA-binding LacI/PurR family transcriptional regulator